jgi:hypothetical protein
VLGHPPADALDALGRAHRLHDPRRRGRPVALARLRSADHDDRSRAGQEIAGPMLLRGVGVERRRVGDATDGGACFERNRFQLRGGAGRESSHY